MRNIIVKLILITITLLILSGCVQNMTVETRPADIEPEPYTAASGKQIVQLDKNNFLITASTVTYNLVQDKRDDLTKLKAAKTALEYYRKQSVDSRFLTIYTDSFDKLSSSHFLNLKEQVELGLVNKITPKEQSSTDMGEKILQVSTYQISVTIPVLISEEISLMTSINKNEISISDTLTVLVQTEKPCYLTILNILPDGTVYTIFDNVSQKKIISGEINTFSTIINSFPSEDIQKGVIKIFASSNPIDLGITGVYKESLLYLLGQLSRFSNSDLTEIDFQYSVLPKKL